MRRSVIPISLVATLLLSALPAAARVGGYDDRFSGNGIARLGGQLSYPRDLAVDGRGRILVAGVGASGYPGTRPQMFAIDRLGPNANPDTTWGGDGQVLTRFTASDAAYGSQLNAIALEPGGKIVAVGGDAGTSTGPNWKVAVVRYLHDGSRDRTFAEDGRMTLGLGIGPDVGTGVAVQSGGKIIVVGRSRSPSGAHHPAIAVIRLEPDGSLDSTFAEDGTLELEVPGWNQARATSVAIDTEGNILVGGSAGPVPDGVGIVARLTPGGALDKSFGVEGFAVTSHAMARAHLALQTEGSIVLAGLTPVTWDTTDAAIARFTADGAPDGSFGGDGWVRKDFGGRLDFIEDEIIDPEGRIIVIGAAYDGPTNTVVARFTPDGHLMSRFGIRTLYELAGSGQSSRGYAIAWDNGSDTIVGTAQYSKEVQETGGSRPAAVAFRLRG